MDSSSRLPGCDQSWWSVRNQKCFVLSTCWCQAKWVIPKASSTLNATAFYSLALGLFAKVNRLLDLPQQLDRGGGLVLRSRTGRGTCSLFRTTCDSLQSPWRGKGGVKGEGGGLMIPYSQRRRRNKKNQQKQTAGSEKIDWPLSIYQSLVRQASSGELLSEKSASRPR